MEINPGHIGWLALFAGSSILHQWNEKESSVLPALVALAQVAFCGYMAFHYFGWIPF